MPAHSAKRRLYHNAKPLISNRIHTVLPLVHWLPKSLHRMAFRRTGYAFFADEANLNLMIAAELRRIMRRIPTYSYGFADTRLWGWTSNLVLKVHR